MFTAAVLLAATVASPGQSPPGTSARAADVPQLNPDPAWRKSLMSQQHALTNQPCQVCFIGDSLTEFWLHTGRLDWETEFSPLKSINLGRAADRTEHILERIRRLDFSRARPKVLVLMMGTNNLGMDPPDAPEAVLSATRRAVAMLQQKIPQASIILLTLTPSGEEPRSTLRQRIQQTNTLLAREAWPAGVRTLPVYDIMVDADDRWLPGFTLDGTHFSADGYGRLAAALAPAVKETLQRALEAPQTPSAKAAR